MTVKKVQIKPQDNAYADILHPETDDASVIMSDGTTLLASVVAVATPNKILKLDGTGKLPASITGNAATVTTNANLTGDVTSVGNATTLSNTTVVAGTYPKVTVDAKGRVTAGMALLAADIPTLTLAKISDAGTVASKDTGTSVGNIPIIGSDGKLDVSIFPSIALMDTFVVASQTAMLALTAQTGDIAVRTDISKSFILRGTNPATLTDWQELLTPTDSVTSVAGKTGVVTLTSSDVGLGNVANESKATMFTNAALTGTPTAPTAPTATNTTQIATTAFVKAQAYLTGNQNITVSGDATGSGTTAISLTLANSGAVAGTYKSVTVDAKGRVTAGTNPTTLAGYGITDAATSTHTHTVDALSDAVITSVADNEVLAYDTATAKWINQTAAEAGLALASHNHTVDSLSNVVVTTVADNEVLAWDSTTSKWINQTAAEAGLAVANHGNHVPTVQAANNAVYLRNDNTWQAITPSEIGAAQTGGANTFTGNQTAPVFVSNIATGTAPFTVTSTTQVANLNVDLFDGYHIDRYMWNNKAGNQLKCHWEGTPWAVEFDVDAQVNVPVYNSQRVGGKRWIGGTTVGVPDGNNNLLCSYGATYTGALPVSAINGDFSANQIQVLAINGYDDTRCFVRFNGGGNVRCNWSAISD